MVLLSIIPVLIGVAALAEPAGDPGPARDDEALAEPADDLRPAPADAALAEPTDEALADPAEQLVVLGGLGDPSPLRRQVRAELGALGLIVVDAPGVDLSEVDCGLVVDAARREARIVVRSDRSGRILKRTLALPRLESDSSIRVEALQIIDVLQTMRTEAQRPAASDPPPPGPEPARARGVTPSPSSRALAVWAAGGVKWNSGGLTPGLHVDVGLAWRLRPWVAAALVSSWPVIARQHRSPEGRVQVWPLSVAAGARFTVGTASDGVRFELLPVVGAVLSLMRGEALPPFISQRRRALGLAAQLRPGMSIRLHPSVRLRIDGVIGGQWPRVVIGVVGRDEAALDSLVLGGSAGLEFSPSLGAGARRVRRRSGGGNPRGSEEPAALAPLSTDCCSRAPRSNR